MMVHCSKRAGERPLAVALIQTPCYELDDDRLEPPLGLLYLATWLKGKGFPVQVVDLSSVPSERWSSLIPAANVFGFSTFTTTYSRTLEIVKLVRSAHPSARTVAGGPHASALPEETVRDFDFTVVGEGEIPFLQLLRALAGGRAAHAIWSADPIGDLDSLPFPDYSLVELDSYRRVVGNKPSVSILSARGCPYRCAFCNSVVLGRRRQPRFRSAANVVEEMRQINGRWGVAAFRFQDDLFTINVQRLRELTALLRPQAFTYRCFGRVGSCTREVAELLFQGGCRHIAFGVESGSDLLLRRMQKDQTTQEIREGIANAKAAGLLVRVYLLVGFPGETWETIKETVELMEECRPDEFAVYPLIPYPGTPIFENPQAFSISAISRDYSQYFQVKRDRATSYLFRADGLDERAIAEMRQHVMTRLEAVATWAGDSKAFR